MTVTSSRILTAVLLSSAAIALGAGLTSGSRAEDKELRIGFIAPMTGPFAQVGKDMVDGFNLYLEEAKGEFAGAKVKVIVEDDQAKPDTGVTKAKKLILQDKVHMIVGGVLALDRLRAGAGQHHRQDRLYCRRLPAADDLTQRDLPKYPYLIRTGWSQLAAASRARPVGLRPGLQEDRRRSPPTMRSATRWSAASRRCSRIAAARSSRRSGRRSAPRTSGHSSRPSRRTPTRCFTLMVGPMALQFPKQLRAVRLQEADRRRRHEL